MVIPDVGQEVLKIAGRVSKIRFDKYYAGEV
jgi:hypothetical protein